MDVDATALGTLTPALKQHWAARLRRATVAPEGAGLVSPEVLVLMMDHTLRQMAKGSAVAPTGRTATFRRFQTQQAGCQCGLHLLSGYYLAGARALRETMPAEWGPARRAMLRRFVRLARREMNALCDACNQQGGSLCAWQLYYRQTRPIRRPP